MPAESKLFTLTLSALFILSVLWANHPVRAADDQPTTRVVSLVPNLTEIAFAIGAGDRIVGVSDYCIYPPEAKTRPSVGGLINPSLEGVLKLRPDVVLLYRSQTDFASRLKTLNVRTALFQVDTLDDLYAAVGRVGSITGETTGAERLARQLQAGLNSVKETATGLKAARGIIIVSRDPSGLKSLYQASDQHFLGQLFRLAGGTLAIPGGAAITREDIIRANPEIIIDLSSSAISNGSASTADTPPAREVGPWSALVTVAAVKDNAVYQWNNPHATLLGPSILKTADTFREILGQLED